MSHDDYNPLKIPENPYDLLREAASIMKRLGQALTGMSKSPDGIVRFTSREFMILGIAADYINDTMDEFDKFASPNAPGAREAVADLMRKCKSGDTTK